MSVDFELEPEVMWSKISTCITTGKLNGVTIQDSKKSEPWKSYKTVHLLNKGKRYLYVFDIGKDGVLFKEFGSEWSPKHPILDAISKHFGVKYYADIDSEEWDEHVKRTTKKGTPQHQTKLKTKSIKPTKMPSVYGSIFGRK